MKIKERIKNMNEHIRKIKEEYPLEEEHKKELIIQNKLELLDFLLLELKEKGFINLD